MRNLTNRVAEGCRERRGTRRKQETRA
ncbi:TetR/AcrR family transcriptional regulator, partial [Escherichia coli]|nr:TetR/AcrR family transcriptional regulator [Escherichia coli]